MKISSLPTSHFPLPTDIGVLPLKCRSYHTRTAGSDPLAPSDRGFFVGPENRLLETVVQCLLGGKQAATLFESHGMPITFYGPSGCGKTHLVYGLFQNWKQRHRRDKAVYQSGADFARQYADALETRTIENFRLRLRRAPLWVVDAVEELGAKAAAQEEFLYSLEYAVQSGNTVLLTMSRFPGDESLFSPRLTARLLGGLTVPFVPPVPKTRLAMLREIAHHFRISSAPTALAFLAKNLDLPYPGLYGSLTQASAEAGERALDVPMLRKFLKNRDERTRPTLAEILRQTARYFSLKQTDLKGKSRQSEIARARAMGIYLSRQLSGKSLKEIGQFFGGRDHKTVAHHCEETEAKVATDPLWGDAAARIRERISAGSRGTG